MIRIILTAIVYPIERAFYAVEMAAVRIRRTIRLDLGNILSGFDRMVEDLDRYVDREIAANTKDVQTLGALYDRIDARRQAVGRAQATASNIRQLTGQQ